jgi:two-component system phosphate regulon sensor histidine kinase PhoR
VKLGIRGRLLLVSVVLIALSAFAADAYLAQVLETDLAAPWRVLGGTADPGHAAVPLMQVDHAIGRLRGMLWFATFAALVAAVVMSALAASWMARGVRGLTDAARRMAEGDLDVRTRAVGDDEVATLGRALDRLAGSLRSALGQLGAERDLMARVLDGMREGVLLLDAGGRVALANPALREMLLLGADVSGKSLLEVVRNAALKDLLDEARDNDETVSRELELGELKPRRVLVHTLRLTGEPGGILGVFVDVTDLRRLESVRRDFVANVSHELRTPVAAIRGAAETLRRAAATDAEAAARFIDIIERNAERLHRLVEDLLDLSRIESREYRLHLEAVDVSTVAGQIMPLFRARAEEKRMNLRAELAEGLGLARADRRALEQVLFNLVDNAVKYGSEGGSVRVHAAREADLVRVSVHDTGPGIEQKHLARLFERFYRVDAGRSRDLGGTGLGLSIVKHLVEVMGGSVRVESTVGVGTKFSFTLPAV